MVIIRFTQYDGSYHSQEESLQKTSLEIMLIMKEWTPLIYLFFICGLISSINGQQFQGFGQGQQLQGQRNPPQFQQFLQTRQAASGVSGTAGRTATGLTNSVRTVTVPILPAPPGTDLTQGTTFTQFQRGASQTGSPDGPIPRFTQGGAFLGSPFTRFGPNMRRFQQGTAEGTASMAAARQRQAQLQQNAQQIQGRQQGGMAGSRTPFSGLGLAMQRRMAQQQFMGQQQNGNTATRGFAQRQQAIGQNQRATGQNQQAAGTLWRPDVRMPGMMTPPGGAFPSQRFPGMFPPGFVAGRGPNRNIARQNGAATGRTGASNALNSPRSQQTLNRPTPIMNPRDPRLGLMPVQANLMTFGSRQRPFPTPNSAANQIAMNRQNRINNNAMNAAQTNRINPNFPPVNSAFPGAVGSRTMPPNFGAFPGRGGRAMPSSVGSFPGNGGGAVPSNVRAFPGGQTNAAMSANQIIPSNVDQFPGTDGSSVTNELPGEISAFPGAESPSGSSTSAATEFIGDIPAFPGADPAASSRTSDLPVFPGNIRSVTSEAISPVLFSLTVNGEEPGLAPGEIPPPPPVFPAKDINNIPASADAELFPPFDLETGSSFSEGIPPVPAADMMGSSQNSRRVNSGSTVEVTVVEPSSTTTEIKPAVSSFPGLNSADVAPPKTGNMAAPVMTKPIEAPTFSEFPNTNLESGMSSFPEADTFPGAGTSGFPGAGTSSFPGAGTSSFPGVGTEVTSSFPGMGNDVGSQKASLSMSGSEVQSVASSFPGTDVRSEVTSSPGSHFISAATGDQTTETSSGMAVFPGTGSSMSSFPGKGTEMSSTVFRSKGLTAEATSGVEGFVGSGSPVSGVRGTDMSSSIGGVPIELWER
ncbi:mucin-19-like isoform X5 [Mytilus californianus]|uniref:mucin-19-like isoform X5 n=1 Tax=Mytilus californianus TaxID=6549 RepID=UPI0022465AAA|nr:mucin-19-like isoform X5 [Mytilus californianus]